MTRHALIIVAPGVKGQSGYLAGTEVDAKNYHNFLYDKIGGDWYSSEIVTLVNPTKQEVLNAISAINSDYSLVVFSGHGCIQGATGLTHVDVKDGDLSEAQLKTKSKKQTLIIDSCRAVVKAVVENQRFSKAMNEGAFTTIANARKVYEDHLQQCEEGIIILYSCDVNQASTDNELKGGAFSSSLIKAGYSWGGTPGYSQVLDLQTAFNNGVTLMNTDFPMTTQEPRIGGTNKRKFWFPFALRPSKSF